MSGVHMFLVWYIPSAGEIDKNWVGKMDTMFFLSVKDNYLKKNPQRNAEKEEVRASV